MVPVKISSTWLREQVQAAFADAVRYGIRRAYKHSDATPPSDAQEDTIIAEVEHAIDTVLDWGPPDE